MIDISIPLLYRRSHLFGHRFRHRRALGLACSKAPRCSHQSLASHPPSETRPCMTSCAPCIISPAISLSQRAEEEEDGLAFRPTQTRTRSHQRGGAGRCTTVPACQCRTNPLDIYRLSVQQSLSVKSTRTNISHPSLSTVTSTTHVMC